MKTIIHVTPHMGTGVGKAISSLAIGAHRFDPRYDHEIIVLEKPIKDEYHKLCDEHGIVCNVIEDPKRAAEMATRGDILQVEWWHHPLTFAFLWNLQEEKFRSVFWVHVSGCNHPYVQPSLVSAVDKVVWTSEYSRHNPYWNKHSLI